MRYTHVFFQALRHCASLGAGTAFHRSGTLGDEMESSASLLIEYEREADDAISRISSADCRHRLDEALEEAESAVRRAGGGQAPFRT